MTINSLAHLSDRELLDHVERASASARSSVAELLELLGEVDARKLFLPEGCRSLFAYCTSILGFSEDETYFRIGAARAARDFPALLDRFREGSLTLTTMTLLRPHLTPQNADALIAAATHKSKREVEHQMAALDPKPDPKPLVRRLPEPTFVATDARPATLLTDAAAGDGQGAHARTTPGSVEAARQLASPAPRSTTTPLSSDRFLLRVAITASAHANLRRAQDLMRHSNPSGDPSAVVERALALLVEDLERTRLAKVARPRPGRAADDFSAPATRYIPASIKRDVWARDEGRCAFVGRKGRCTEIGGLEFHHVVAFALGGRTTTENLALRCRAHNQYEGALLFGFEATSRIGATEVSPGSS